MKKNLGSGTTGLIISNKEIEDIIKIVKTLEESSLLMKDVSKATENEAKELKRGSLSTLLGKLGASQSENSLACEVIIRAGEGVKAVLVKAVQNF